MKKTLLFLAALFLWTGFTWGQTLISPTGDGGFENGATFTDNGWTVVNGTNNMWYVGNAPVASGGANCAFTGTGPTTWVGAAVANVNHFYKDITIPAGQFYLNVSVRYKVVAPDATYDFLRVFLVPTTTVPVAGTQLASGQISGSYDTPTAYTTAIFGGGVTPGSTVRLVFSWRSDGVSPHAAVAVDEISAVAVPTAPSYTATALGGLWNNAATWVGGEVPVSGANVTIPVGSTVVVNQSIAAGNLTINGKLQWITTTTPSATVNQIQAINITVGATGELYAHGTATAGAVVQVTGDFINNGIANFAVASANLRFNGSGATQTLGGTGTFIADQQGRGMIHTLWFLSTSACAITTTQNIVATSFAHTAGSLNTNGKLSIDNTCVNFGGLINRSINSVVVNAMGAGYTSAPTVAFTAAPAGGVTATGVANFDAATGTVRSITITNPGDGYRVAPTVTLTGGGFTTTASAVAILYQSISSTTVALTQKSAVASITGGLSINNTQGVGSVFATNGGTGYTSAPTVGFALPIGFQNLVTNGGSGYTSAPTVTFSGGGGATQATGTAVVTRGQVTSVVITAGGTGYTSVPTITFTGGGGTGATAAVPVAMLPTATATIDAALGMITNFTITNPGYGYLLTFPSVTLTGGGGTGAVATSRHSLYNLSLSYFAPATTNPIHTESVAIPANRKIHALTIGAGNEVAFTSNLELYALAPFTNSGIIDMGSNTLTFSHPSYTGTAGSATAYITNGSINYKLLGSASTQTRAFPFNSFNGVDNHLVSIGSAPTVATTGSTILSLTGSMTAAPSGLNMIGTRTLRIQTHGGLFGNDPTVRLSWNSLDALTSAFPVNQNELLIGQAAAVAGPWTVRSIVTGTAIPIAAAGGSRVTAITAPGPITATDEYFGWNIVPPLCYMPGGLTTTMHTTTTANLMWNAAFIAPDNGYEWEVRTTGAGGSGATGLVATGTTAAGVTTASASGLTLGTAYNLYVRSVCGGANGSSLWAGPHAFTTAFNVTYVQNFDAALTYPDGWRSYASAAARPWSVSNSTTIGAYSTPNFIGSFFHSTMPKDEYLVSPAMNLTAGVNYRLRFWLKAPGWSGVPEKLKIIVSNSPTQAGVLAGTTIWDRNNLLVATYTEQTISFTPTTSGSHYFSWHSYSIADVDYIAVDNITLDLMPPPCAVPAAQPTALLLTPTSTSIAGSFTAVTGVTGYVVVRSTSSSLSATPVNNTTYSVGTALGNGTIVLVGSGTTFTSSSLNSSTPYYFFVFAYNAGADCIGPVYRTVSPLSASSTTLPAPPATLVATSVSATQINLTATPNSDGNNIVVAWNTTATFGTPSGPLNSGAAIPGGGTVHYVGEASGLYPHTGLTQGTNYFYRVWTVVAGPLYSSTFVSTNTTTFFGVPYLQDFNASTTLPGGWTGTFTIISNHGTNGSNGLTRNMWSSVTTANAVSPSIVLPSAPSRLMFDYRIVNYTGFPATATSLGPNDKIDVQVSTDGGTVFTTVHTINQYTHTVATTFANRKIDLTAYSGPIRVRFLATWGTGDYYVNIDNFIVEVTPIAPIFLVTPSSKDFGSVRINTTTADEVFTVRNNGIGTLVINSVQLSGANVDQFVLTDANTYPVSLTEGQSITMNVKFAPTSMGSKVATLAITDNLAAKVVRNVPLQGIGVDPTITTFAYYQGFELEAFPPVGWTNIRTAGTGTPGTWNREVTGTNPTISPRTGTAMLRFNSFSYAAGTKAELITPPINFPSNDFSVSFWMYRDNGYLTNADLVNVYYNTTNSTSYATLLGTINRSINLAPIVTANGWYNYSFNLPSGATGNGRYIILEAVSAYGNNIFIDDFVITRPMSVTHSFTNLNCFGANDGTATLNIDGGSPPYTILWSGPDGFTATTAALTGLAAGTYSYSVTDALGVSASDVITLTQPIAIALPTVSNLTVTYDGLLKTITASAPSGTTLVWYDAASGGAVTTAPSAADAGVYTAWLVAKSTATGCESTRIEVILTINKKDLNVTANNLTKCQNAPNPELTLTYSGFVAGQGAANLATQPTATTTAVLNSLPGTYPITVTGGISNNYNFIYAAGTLTVLQTPVVFAGGNSSVCAGETFPIVAATASNYTTILWTRSGNGTFSNPNSLNPIYTPGSLDIANGSVTLTLTGNPGSACAVSSSMVLTLQNDIPVSVSIRVNTTELCIGSTASFTALPVNGGISPSYQWKVNGVNAGTNNANFSYVPNAGDAVTVVLTSSIGCALNNPATSAPVIVNITGNLVAGVSIVASANNVCDNTVITYTATPVNGGNAPMYQWKVNGVNAGTNSPVFIHTPLNNQVITVVMTSNHLCATVPVATSNAITMIVSPPLLVLNAIPSYGGTVSGGGNYAMGTPVTVTATAAPGWEFLNWRNSAGTIISTTRIFTYTINKCSDELTATFSSTAKIAGQIKYFNANETLIPSPNNFGVFYVQLFHNGVAMGGRQLVKFNAQTGLDSYFEFLGAESGKDYTLRIWEEAVNNTLGNVYTWNKWGGATSTDALVISYMVAQHPILTTLPWVAPTATTYTPYFAGVADVNNNGNLSGADALMLQYRIVNTPGFMPLPGGKHNFQLAAAKLPNHTAKSYPTAPGILLTQTGTYNAATAAANVYYEAALNNLSDGNNVYNIYFVATGDVNASYIPTVAAKSNATLAYNGTIAAKVGDEVLIPVRINQAAELGAITLGLSYNKQLLKVTEVIGYPISNIDHAAGTVNIAWMDQNGRNFAANQEMLVLKARVIGEIPSGLRFMELLPNTEFANKLAQVITNVSLSSGYVATGVTSINDLNSLVLNHQIFPNPFNESSSIHYTLPESGKVRVVIYNHIGQQVKTLIDAVQEAGAQKIRLNNYDLDGAGTYFYRIILESNNKTYNEKGSFVLIK